MSPSAPNIGCGWLTRALLSSCSGPWLSSNEVVSSWVVPGKQTVTDCYSTQWMDGRKPAGRYDHSTAVVDNQLYLWGGYQYGMSQVHDSAKKRWYFSSVEVFNLNNGCWEQRTIHGTPPLGVQGYSCVVLRNVAPLPTIAGLILLTTLRSQRQETWTLPLTLTLKNVEM